MEDMLILQKVFDMMEYGYICLRQFPKSEKFALAVDIKRCMNSILEKVVEASKYRYKRDVFAALQKLDIEVAKMKVYLRLSFKMGFLPIKKYELWSEKVIEIGKMLGGWIRTLS